MIIILLLGFFSVPLSVEAAQCVSPRGLSSAYSSQGKIITFYVPHNAPGCATSVEGCIATSCQGLSGQRMPVCLDDVRLRGAKYVTLASDWSNQGKYYNLGKITYKSAEDGQMHTLENVVGYVHDWGKAFNGRPDKIDVCTTICKNCKSDAEASALASGRNIAYVPNGLGQPDYNSASSFANSGWYNTLRSISPQQAQQSSSPFGNVSPIPISQPPYPDSSSASSTSQLSLGVAAAGIIVQPKSVARGATLSVSWTSVNTSSCRVTFAGQEFANGKEGSKPFKTVSADAGTLTFALQCQDSAGKQYQASASASIQ